MSAQKYNILFITFATLTANMGFLLFDYNMSVFNSVRPYMNEYVFPDASSGVLSFIPSASTITAAIASIFAGSLCAKYGRRKIMLLSDINAIVGVILTLVASLPAVIIGRLLLGFTFGITTVVIPIYFTEIPPIEYVGAAGIGLSVLASIGVLAAFCLGLAVPDEMAPGETSETWRILQAITILIAIVRIINFLFFFKYETPQYLVAHNKMEEAEKALAQVYREGIKERMEELVKERDFINSQGKVKITELFTRKYRRALAVCVVMLSLQQISGLNIVMVFAKTIFADGIDETSKTPTYYSIALAAVFHASSYSLFYFLNKFSRRTLMVYGTFAMGLVELLFGIISKAAGPSSFGSKIFLILWPIPFVLSTGTLPNIMLSETLPEIGCSVCLLANWIWGFLTVQFFPDLTDAMGINGLFILIGSICVVSSVYLYFEAVETKGRHKTEILQQYNGTLKKSKVHEEMRNEKNASDLETLKESSTPADKSVIPPESPELALVADK